MCTTCRWLLTNFDCSCMWVQDAEPLKAALSLMPAFLRAKGNAYDFKACPNPIPAISPQALRLAMSHQGTCMHTWLVSACVEASVLTQEAVSMCTLMSCVCTCRIGRYR